MLQRREFISAAIASTLRAAPAKPNIIFILSDDHHYRCFGAAGNPAIQTPNLDRLATRGVRFENAAISTAQCAPSRGVLLSGVEVYQSGLLSNGKTTFDRNHDPSVVEMLRKAGYRTGLVGKWHISPKPQSLGFTEAPAWFQPGSMRYINPLLKSGFEGQATAREGHVNELLTDASIDFIRREDKPYFLWLAYNAPHTPWQAPPEFMDRHANAAPPPGHPPSARKFDWQTYYAVISHLDFHIGRLLDAVERSGHAENTYIFFLGDNGYLCGAKGLNGKVHPWEASIRVPLLAAGPGVRKGAVSKAMATSVDLPATWLDLAGVKQERPLAGRSLAKDLRTGRGGPDEGFSVWEDPREEALHIRVAVQPYRTVRKGEYKLIFWKNGKEALFNFVSDPNEEKDLLGSPAASAVLKELRASLRHRMQQTNDPALRWPSRTAGI